MASRKIVFPTSSAEEDTNVEEEVTQDEVEVSDKEREEAPNAPKSHRKRKTKSRNLPKKLVFSVEENVAQKIAATVIEEEEESVEEYQVRSPKVVPPKTELLQQKEVEGAKNTQTKLETCAEGYNKDLDFESLEQKNYIILPFQSIEKKPLTLYGQIFTEDDVIVLLRGIIDFKSKHGEKNKTKFLYLARCYNFRVLGETLRKRNK